MMGLTSLVVLVGIAGILIWGIKGMQQSFLKNKRYVKMLLMGYGILLIASVFVYEVLPTNDKEPDFSRSSEDWLDKEVGRIDDAIFNGRTEEVDPRFIMKEWKWKYSGKELGVEEQDWFDGMVIVERKDDNDGIIDGTYYANSVVGGIDLTNEYQPREVTLEKQTLYLKGQWEEKEMKFAIFEKEFVITQFTGERKGGMNFGGFMEINYLYLKIPKDLKIIPENDEVFIHYVGEED